MIDRSDPQHRGLRRLLALAAALLAVAAVVLSPDAVAQQAPAAVPPHRAKMASVALGERFAVPLTPGSSCPADDAAAPDWHDLALEVDGLDTGLRALGCDPSANALVFRLQHRDPPPSGVDAVSYQAAWEDIVGTSIAAWHGHQVKVRIVDKNPDARVSLPATREALLSVAVIEEASVRPWMALGMVAIVWSLTLFLGARTSLIRDPLNDGAGLASRTFSLAKTQLAWWFAIIFASFVFLWLITGDIPALSSQALALLGLSGVTTLAASAVKRPEILPMAKPDVFLDELISDANGPTIQRFQMLVMTVSLGLMFLINVFTRLSMPVFDGSLITLMGISAGTYVAAKIPEDQGGVPVGSADDEADPKSRYSAIG